MDMRIPPLKIKITIESNPLNSIMRVGEPGLCPHQAGAALEALAPVCRLALQNLTLQRAPENPYSLMFQWFDGLKHRKQDEPYCLLTDDISIVSILCASAGQTR